MQVKTLQPLKMCLSIYYKSHRYIDNLFLLRGTSIRDTVNIKCFNDSENLVHRHKRGTVIETRITNN